MRIAIFNTVQLETAGGMEHFCIQTASHLSGLSGVQADCVTMDDAFNLGYGQLHSIYFLRRFDRSTIYRERRESIEARLGQSRYLKCANFQELSRVLGRYDLVYSRNEITEAFLFHNLIGYYRVPPVIFGCHCPHRYFGAGTFHSRLHNLLYSSPLYTRLAKPVAGFHTISALDTRAIKKQFPTHLVEKISNPFDAVGYAAYAQRSSCPFIVNTERFNILWAGRLTEQKGITHLCNLIDAVNRTHGKKIDWHICGQGELNMMIAAAAAEYENVHTHGHICRESMPAAYARANLFISTSQWGETYAYTPREANSLGVPVVAFDISGYNEIIDDGVNGRLARTQSEFVKYVKWFADGNRLDSDIRKHIRTRTDAASSYKQLLQFFDRCI